MKTSFKENLPTKREIEILELIADGYSSLEIAKTLFLSETTIITHKNKLRAKLKARNSCQLVNNGYRSGYLVP